MKKRYLGGVFLAAVAAAAAGVALAQSSSGHNHSAHGAHGAHGAAPGGAAQTAPADTRQMVNFPEPLRTHTLANMRDHLQTLAEIQRLLAAGAFDKASEQAESRLGMTSLQMHGAHDVAGYMPKGMQDAGTAMHRSASQFARIAMDASVTGDLRAPLDALARVSQACVACHAAYRLY